MQESMQQIKQWRENKNGNGILKTCILKMLEISIKSSIIKTRNSITCKIITGWVKHFNAWLLYITIVFKIWCYRFRLFPTYWITYSSLILLSRKFSFHIRLHFNPILHNSKKFECIYGTCDKIQQKEIMYSVSILIGL